MSDATPASKSDETPDETVAGPEVVPQTEGEPVVNEVDPAAEPEVVEPQVVPAASSVPELVEPAPVLADTAAINSAVAEPEVFAEAPVVADPLIAQAQPVVMPAAVAAASSVSAQQLLDVEPAVPPKKRGNRLVGTLLSIAGAVVFAGVYAVVGAFIIDVRVRDLFGPEFVNFLGSAFFWVPVIVFLVGLILLVLLLNRAGWWAHVFGSLILAVAVYLGVIGVLLLIANVFNAAPQRITVGELATNPWVIGSAIVAREVSIWTGLGIAARGRRVKTRNAEARAAFDREQEAKKAEYAGTVAGV